MRILYVNDAWAIWGGLERVMIEKMNYLADHCGYTIYTLTYNQGTHPIPFPLSPNVVHRDMDVKSHHQYRYRGLKRYYFKYKFQKLLIERLKDGILEIKPDIIVCPRVNLIGYLLKAKGRIPLIYESHSSCKWIVCENDGPVWRMKRYYYKSMVKKVQMVVALTEGDALEWRKITNKVCVIPNVVNLNKTGIYSNCITKSVIFVGRISLQKDLKSLLHIWSIVHQSFPEWQLHIYGRPEDEKEKELLLQEIQLLNANIYVHEPTPQIIDKYLEHSMLLLTSRYEPFGLVLPEAMSCGLPVVSFDCPYGPAEIITDGEDGFLITNRSVSGFVEKVCQLIENDALRLKMGMAGIQSSRRFDASIVMPKWKELFNGFVS